jgi:hypothetical protein
VQLTLDLPEQDIDWDAKDFVCQGATYRIDVGAVTWSTQLQLLEVV